MNMSNMIGIGPFLTIPLILKAMNGPQAMLGWVLVLCWPCATAWCGPSWLRLCRAPGARWSI